MISEHSSGTCCRSRIVMRPFRKSRSVAKLLQYRISRQLIRRFRMSNSRHYVRRCLAVVSFLLFVTLVIFFVYIKLHKSTQSKIIRTTRKTWKTRPFVSVPALLMKKAAGVRIENKTIDVKFNDKVFNVFTRTAGPISHKMPVLLLHGATLSSKTWLELKTMHLLAAMGYHVVAPDLPGHGKSNFTISDREKSAFLKAFMEREKIMMPILVSPSMSGNYSLPFMMSHAADSCHLQVGAFIPVAPMGTEKYTPTDYRQCKIPVMIVFGGKDVRLGLPSAGRMRYMPNSEVFRIKGAGHSAYKDKPLEWSRLLYNFLLAIDKKIH